MREKERFSTMAREMCTDRHNNRTIVEFLVRPHQGPCQICELRAGVGACASRCQRLGMVANREPQLAEGLVPNLIARAHLSAGEKEDGMPCWWDAGRGSGPACCNWPCCNWPRCNEPPLISHRLRQTYRRRRSLGCQQLVKEAHAEVEILPGCGNSQLYGRGGGHAADSKGGPTEQHTHTVASRRDRTSNVLRELCSPPTRGNPR